MLKATKKISSLSQDPMPDFLMDLVQHLVPASLIRSKGVYLCRKKGWRIQNLIDKML